jgi:hypothetical protein
MRPIPFALNTKAISSMTDKGSCLVLPQGLPLMPHGKRSSSGLKRLDTPTSKMAALTHNIDVLETHLATMDRDILRNGDSWIGFSYNTKKSDVRKYVAHLLYVAKLTLNDWTNYDEQ